MERKVANSVEKYELFKCACHTEGIMVEKFNDDPDVDLIVWSYGSCVNNSFNWRTRIRKIWRLIRRGDIDGQEIILHQDDLKKLITTLQGFVETEAKQPEPEKNIMVDELTGMIKNEPHA